MNERTYDPTPRRLAEIRRRGDVPLSAELTGGITLVVAVYVLIGRLSALCNMLEELMRVCFKSISSQDLGANGLESGAMTVTRALAGVWLPFLLTVMAVSVAVTIVQTRGLVAMSRLKPNFSRLNPVAGLGRIFSKQGLFETAKGLAKMAILTIVLYSGVRVACVKALGSQPGRACAWYRLAG